MDGLAETANGAAYLLHKLFEIMPTARSNQRDRISLQSLRNLYSRIEFEILLSFGMPQTL